MTDFSPQFPKSFKEPPVDLMFIGEAPGAQEEIEGKPFIGMSGKLLRKTLTEVGIDPEEQYYHKYFLG